MNSVTGRVAADVCCLSLGPHCVLFGGRASPLPWCSRCLSKKKYLFIMQKKKIPVTVETILDISRFLIFGSMISSQSSNKTLHEHIKLMM